MIGSSLQKEKSAAEPNGNRDDDDLMDVRVPSGVLFVEDGDESNILQDSKRPTPVVPQKPDENMEIDDRAILDCWNLTVASHDAVPTAVSDATVGVAALPPQPSTSAVNEYYWRAKDMASPPSVDDRSNPDVVRNWQPKALTLPPWAVDPFETSKS